MRLTDQNPALLAGIWVAIFAHRFVNGFVIHKTLISSQTKLPRYWGQSNDENITEDEEIGAFPSSIVATSRREMMTKATVIASASFLPKISSAEVGSLPELSNTNAFVQGLTINVADGVQQKAMIDFLINSFSFEVRRQRIQDSVEETVSKNK
mmetsp:Transcript_11776/g.12651  ORF Transcript_11776/g.12651 Transcript_11776/m.12651 type:complete len:153 (+) Transcript_11776:133-591(+)